mgnify:CR=1 FL=1
MEDLNEQDLENNSNNSVEDMLTYIMYKMNYPTEDYYWGINHLIDIYPKMPDVRLAILGAYLSSTWLSSRANPFLQQLNAHVGQVDKHTEAIIHYLNAYDIYAKQTNPYPPHYKEELEKSVSLSSRFVYNRLRLSEVTSGSRKKALIQEAIEHVEEIWSESDLLQSNYDSELHYDGYVSEFILGISISDYEFRNLKAML